MSFLIKSDTACPWSIDADLPVRGRFDVLIDFLIESVRGGAREVYIMLCDGTTYRVSSIPSDRARDVASWLLSTTPFKADLASLISKYRRVYYMHERGRDASGVALDAEGLYVFGDQDGLSADDERILRERAVWVSLGPLSYISWHAAVYVAYLVRRQGRGRRQSREVD